MVGIVFVVLFLINDYGILVTTFGNQHFNHVRFCIVDLDSVSITTFDL